MKKIIYLLTALALLTTGCYKDTSSTRFDPMGDILVSGIETEYRRITLLSNLTIEPTVGSSLSSENTDQFQYLWTIYNARDRNATKDTLAQTKNINLPITLDPAEYIIELRVTNHLGYSVFHTTTLFVETAFSNGWYFLKETAQGHTELDFFGREDWTESGAWRITPDLLQSRLGITMPNPPTSLGFFPQFEYVDATGERHRQPTLIAMAGRDLRTIRIDDVSMIHERHEDLFFSETAPLNASPVRAFQRFSVTADQGFGSADIPVIFYNTGSVYTFSTIGKVGEPVTGTFGNIINVDPTRANAVMLGNNWFGSHSFASFDTRNRRLAIVSNNGFSGDAVRFFNPENFTGTISAVDIISAQARALHMGMSGWCVVEDGVQGSIENPLRRTAYKLNTGIDQWNLRDPIEEMHDITATNFRQAQVYGSNKVSSHEHILYGSIDNRFYTYNTTTRSEARIDLPAIGSGEVITMITHRPGVHNPNNRNSPSAGFLFIATHHAGSNTYKVYMYGMLAGAPTGDPVAIMSGTGKVVDMQYAGGVHSTYSGVL